MPTALELMRQQYMNLLEDEKIDELKEVEDTTVGTGSRINDFYQQAKWGAFKEASFGAADASDAYSEYRGQDTWQDLIAGDASGDWEQLSDWAKAGQVTGQAIGMLPTLGVASLLSKGGQKLAGILGSNIPRVGNWAYNRLSAKAADDILAGFKKTVGREDKWKTTSKIFDVDDAGKAKLSSKVKQHVDDTYNYLNDNKIELEIGKNISQEQTDLLVQKNIKKNITELWKIEDDEVLTALSRQTQKIVSEMNPQDVQQNLTRLVQTLPILRQTIGRSELGANMLAAMGNDAMIGVAMATQRAVLNIAYKKNWGVDFDLETRSYDYTKNYDIDLSKEAIKWLHDATETAAHFSLIGPVKFFSGPYRGGGTQAHHAKRLYDIFRNKIPKVLTPVKNFTPTRLQKHIDVLNEISGGNLTKSLGSKFIKRSQDYGAKWWQKSTSKDNVKAMRELVSAARRQFFHPIKGAHAQWAKEFGLDVVASLPRMTLGVLAMNSTNVIKSFKDNGWSFHGLRQGLGGSGPEQVANIMTAAYFTRRPHKLNLEATPKMLKKMFNTKELPHYFNAKQNKLRKILDGMETFGATDSGLDMMLLKWRPRNESRNDKINGKLRRVLSSTQEHMQIEKIISQYKGSENLGGADIQTAFREHLYHLIQTKKLDKKDIVLYEDRLRIVEEIIKHYDANSIDPLKLESYTPEQAWNIVQELSQIQFDGKQLTINRPDKQLDSFADKHVLDSVLEPQRHLKDFITSIYNTLGIEVNVDSNGNLQLPKLSASAYDIAFSDKDIKNTFAVVYGEGVRNNWIKPLKETSQIPGGGEIQAKTKEIWRSSSEAMMEYVYGERWREKESLDISILEDRAWSTSYYKAERFRQVKSAYEIFAEGRDPGLSVNDVDVYLNEVKPLMFSKEKPTLQDFDQGKTAPENYGEISQFIDRMHNIVTTLHPDLPNKGGAKIDFEKAEALFVKTNEILGDVFTNREAYKQLDNYILDRALTNLGIDNMIAGLDIKTSLVSLMRNSEFNNAVESITPLFPKYVDIRNHLMAQLKNNKISKETYDNLLEHYDHILNAVKASKYPIEFMEAPPAEPREGAWVEALTKSRATGEYAIYNLSTRRIEFTLKELELVSNKLKHLELTIKQGVDAPYDGDIKKADSYLAKVSANRKATIELKDMIKRALKERNPYMLRALARKEGTITDALERLNKQAGSTISGDFAKEILRITESVQKSYKELAINESSIEGFLKEQIAQFKLPGKDTPGKSIRVSSSMFSLKYDLPVRILDKYTILEKDNRQDVAEIRSNSKKMLEDYLMLDSKLQTPELTRRVNTAIETLNKFADKEILTPENYYNMVAEPLRIHMEVYKNTLPKEQRLRPEYSDTSIDSDLYTILSTSFSKKPVKTLKVNIHSKKLMLGSKVVGDVKDRGLWAIINALDPNQNFIYLAETTGTDMNNRVIRNINGDKLQDINVALQTGDFSVDNTRSTFSEYLKTGDSKELGVGIGPPAKAMERYIVIPINEKTSFIVRTDTTLGDSLHDAIRAEYSPEGTLYKRLEAIYDMNIDADLPAHKGIRTLLNKIQNPKTEVDIVNAIKLTRMIYNHPAFLQEVIGRSGDINLEHPAIKDLYKRDPLTETKNGFVPTEINRSRAAMIYKSSKSQLFKSTYNEIKEWIEPDSQGNYKKMKVLSFDDTTVKDANGNDVNNIFDSFNRAKIRLQERFDKGEITQITKDKMEALLENPEFRKSIMDSDFFASKKLYLASMSLIGLHPDYVKTGANGQVIGFKSGAIKPTITYNNVDLNTGGVQQWFTKTAMKYNPDFEPLLQALGVDAITFKSANKINKLKNKAKDEFVEPYTKLKAPEANDFSKTWVDWVGESKNITDKNILEIPLDAFSLRTVSKEGEGQVGANLSVHMNHNSGVSDWIGIDNKTQILRENVGKSFNDPFYRTGIAKKILGERAETGDPSVVNSAISYMLLNDGLIVEPWAMRQLESHMVGYFLNNGTISGGRVNESSMDVMTGDLGNLDITIRSSISYGEGRERPTVQYYGEFLPSYYGANKNFERRGANKNGVQNVLIKTIEYTAENGDRRKADAYIADVEGQLYLYVEGRYIDSKGQIRDINTSDKLNEKAIKDNKKAYDDLLAADNKFYDDILNGKYEGKDVKLFEVALELKDSDLSVGVLNSRQPRNMMGDIVISKLAIGPDGNPYTPEMGGNVSRMNYIDAIKPQDADFDFDKSVNYTSAPGLFWKETNKVAGHITGISTDNVINKLFEPNINTGRFAKTLPDLLGADTSNDRIFTEVAMAKGRFIKMHQTATYLANMFGTTESITTFKTNLFKDPGRIVHIGLNTKGKYISTVDNVSNFAKLFIDMYDALPSKTTKDRLTEIQNKIWFGEQGLFELFTITDKGEKVKLNSKDFNLNQDRFNSEKQSILNRFIRPLNTYLKFNRGVAAETSGIERAARIYDYSQAWNDFVVKSLDIKKKYGVNPDINMEAGLLSAGKYFMESRNPYDIAMKELHDIQINRMANAEIGDYGRARSIGREISDYINNGLFTGDIKDFDVNYNRLFKKALSEYTKDEASLVNLQQLAAKEKSLMIELERLENFKKPGTGESIELKEVRDRLQRVQEIKISLEESLSYMLPQDPTNPMIKLPNRGYKKNTYFNGNDNVVIVDSRGNVKEVILKGNNNKLVISSKDTIIKNGRRFKQVDGESQRALRALSEAYTGNVKIRTGTGKDKVMSIDTFELQTYIAKDYAAIQKQIVGLKDQFDMTRETTDKVHNLISSVIYDNLFNLGKAATDPGYRKALILRLLMPESSNKITALRNLNSGQYKATVMDALYFENMLNQPTWTLLSKIANGEFERDSMHRGHQDFAKEILKEVNFMKTAAMIRLVNPNISFEYLTSKMYVEPASIQGFMTSKVYLSQDVFDMQKTGNQIQREAAKIMYNYATGTLIDPVNIYLASREMQRAGISLSDQWGIKKMVNNPDGTLTDFGAKKVFVSEQSNKRRQNLGERRRFENDVEKETEELFRCYKGD